MATSSDVKYGEDLDAANLQLAALSKLITVASFSNSKSKLVTISEEVQVISNNAQKYTKGICRATLPTLKIIANMAKTISDDNFEELTLKQANKLMASILEKAQEAQNSLAIRHQEVNELVTNRRNSQDTKYTKLIAQNVFKDFKELPSSVVEGAGDQLVTTDKAGRYNKYADLNMIRAAKLLTDIGPTVLENELLINQECVTAFTNIIVSTFPGLTESEAAKLDEDVKPVYSGFWIFKNQLVIGVKNIDENTKKIISQEINKINSNSPEKYYFSSHDMIFIKLKGNPLNWLWAMRKDTKLKMTGKFQIDYCGFVTGESIESINGLNTGNALETRIKELMLNPINNKLYQENKAGVRAMALRELRQQELERQRNLVKINKINVQERIAENDLMKKLIERQNILQEVYSKKLSIAVENLNIISQQMKMPNKEVSLLLERGIQFFAQAAAKIIWDVKREEAVRNIPNLGVRKAKFAEIGLQEKELHLKACSYLELTGQLSELKARLKLLKTKIELYNTKMIEKYKKELGHLHG